MKILIVSQSDIGGGAARAAYRLHKSLLSIDVNSMMLVQSKHSDDHTVIGPETKLKKGFAQFRPTLDKLPVQFYKKRTKTPFSPAWLPYSGVVKHINDINPDIVHLHWINGGFIKIKDVSRIKYPIVWTLHDMWPFTGGCHYNNEGCVKFIESCDLCPVLGSKKYYDLSYRTFKRKIKYYNNLPITVVGLSKWLTESAKNSKLFGRKNIINLPNPIDTEIFKPLDKHIAREMLGMPQEKKIILFGASKATDTPRKGFKELTEALRLVNASNVELAVFGSGTPQNPPDFSFPVHYLGRFNDDLSLSVLYSAADVMVVPSLQENLSNVIMESLSCGTPVVAFDIGGNGDMIDQKINGYLAKPYDPSDLASGIEWILNNSNDKNLSDNCRSKVINNFEMKIVAKKYIELYEDILRK